MALKYYPDSWCVKLDAVVLPGGHRVSAANQQLVLLALVDCADEHLATCYPSQSYLAAMTRLSERTVQYAVEALERAGVIERRARYKNAMKGSDEPRSYEYLLRLPSVEPRDRRLLLRERQREAKGRKKRVHHVRPEDAPNAPLEDAPHSPSGCTTCALEGAPRATDPLSEPLTIPAEVEPRQIRASHEPRRDDPSRNLDHLLTVAAEQRRASRRSAA